MVTTSQTCYHEKKKSDELGSNAFKRFYEVCQTKNLNDCDQILALKVFILSTVDFQQKHQFMSDIVKHVPPQLSTKSPLPHHRPPQLLFSFSRHNTLLPPLSPPIKDLADHSKELLIKGSKILFQFLSDGRIDVGMFAPFRAAEAFFRPAFQVSHAVEPSRVIPEDVGLGKPMFDAEKRLDSADFRQRIDDHLVAVDHVQLLPVEHLQPPLQVVGVGGGLDGFIT